MKQANIVLVGVSAVLLLAIIISQQYFEGQFTRQAASLTDIRTFASPELGFVLRVPQDWSQPQTIKHTTVTEVRFDHKLTVIAGQHYSDLVGRNLTMDDIAQHMFPGATVEDVTINGYPAKKVMRGAGDGRNGYVIIAKQPQKSAEDIMMIYVENDKQAESVASSFSFIRS